ncbi:MAG: hypothetical protein HXO31_10430 [Prevotella sp.]|jgi:hypothetical protein|uniref:DUF4435 domain-containing protein n=1 Tax=Prevotella melaninogenica TaxID=28132 RepID=UPI001C5E8BB5|nr:MULTISPECIES: DUF4435 domain-containing protein [Prevotella]MBF1583743.1 hypothetical protein [Prevotella sp.]MBF1600173.1 hypothetical protein [Prevotella sp.]MBW4723336.1 DUF4435 domain-containing protein [Prevotella melaninogenica]
MKNSVLEELEPQSFVEENRIIGNTVLEANDSPNIVADIRLTIQHPDHKEVIIVVEGEDDEKALKQFFNIQVVEFFLAENCLKVKNSMRIVSKDEQLKDCVIGIKDADFDHINQIKHNIANLMVTDTHDMETLMLTPKVCECICWETIKEEYPNLSFDAMTSLKNLSYLRYYNDKMIFTEGDSNNDGISFKKIKICKLIPNNQPVSVEDVLKHVKEKGNSNKTSFPDLNTMNQFIQENPINDGDLVLFTNGHDLVSAIRNILHSKATKAKEYSEIAIAALIRAYFSKEEFEKTNLYKDIDNWNNNRFNLWAV